MGAKPRRATGGLEDVLFWHGGVKLSNPFDNNTSTQISTKRYAVCVVKTLNMKMYEHPSVKKNNEN